MFFTWIFICRLHRDYKKVSTKISFSHQFATILMDQNNNLFWWRVTSTCILFTVFHLLLLFSSLLWVIFLGSNLLCPLSFLQCMFHHIYSLRNRALGQHKKLCSIVICMNIYLLCDSPFRDWPSPATLCYRNCAKIAILTCEQKPYLVNKALVLCLSE